MRQAIYAALQKTGTTIRELADEVLLQQFALRRDESAFEALVKRHGPMVQGVCRRILGDAHDAEDAFQAVFLVLARKSKSIRKPELLANWLYGVACRIARKARMKAIRKEARERRAGKMPVQDQLLDLEWNELKAVLDDELQQLPEKYRAPLVLCYLRGQTNAQAAAQLGWPAGSISERLARAREMLRARLNRRGLTLSAGLLAVLLSQKAASAAVSPLLIRAAVRVGVSSISKSSATAGTVSKAVLELAGEAPTILGYLKAITVVLIVAVLFVNWPSVKRVSEQSLWYVLGAIAWDQSSALNGELPAGKCAPRPQPAP
jgi:RNA polymerase sigma factor (sigma-70 family)